MQPKNKLDEAILKAQISANLFIDDLEDVLQIVYRTADQFPEMQTNADKALQQYLADKLLVARQLVTGITML